MKFDKNKAFPYPVLRPHSDDYKEAEFQTNTFFNISNEKVIASCRFDISSDEIGDEIEKENAEFVLVISCRDTYFQKVVSSKVRSFSQEFETGELRGEVRIDSYVVAVKEINKFASADINDEFGIGPFKFRVGDVMAQDETDVFYFDRDMFRPITAVFELVKDDNLTDGIWKVAFDEEHIQIKVSPETKGSIDQARNSTKNRAVLINSIYFSAAMQAIQHLKDSEDEHKSKKWGEVILNKAQNEGLDLEAEDAYYLTEKLLQEPLKRLKDLVFKGEGL